jgi:hypothetical protein
MSAVKQRYRSHGRRMSDGNTTEIGAAIFILALTLMALPARAAGQEPPYSCQLLYGEQKKCAFGSCDKQVIDRLTKECLRDGGRP